MRRIYKAIVAAALPAALSFSMAPVQAAPFFFSTGDSDGLVGTGSRPTGPSGIEIESADDFILSQATSITGATFNGLVPLGAVVTALRLEIYRVFPADSNNPPSGNVPTRDNSPSDVAFQEREGADLGFTTSNLGAFSVANTVLNGINSIPNQTTLGEGPASGDQLVIDVSLNTPFNLPADHYFFIPQVELDNGDFLWLSAAKPIVGGTGPFVPDLQSWIRNEDLAPDWLRIGTDVIGDANGQGVKIFNAAFSLSGETEAVAVSEPSGLVLLGIGLCSLLGGRRAGKRASTVGRTAT